MQERRKVIRSRIVKSAKLIFGASSVIDCVVRNLTAAGARVQIPNTGDLPEGLTMYLRWWSYAAIVPNCLANGE